MDENQIHFDLSNLNSDFDVSLVNYIENLFCNISKYNTIAIMIGVVKRVQRIRLGFRFYSNIKKPAFIFDGRNILEIEKIRKIGFNYIGIGRK